MSLFLGNTSFWVQDSFPAAVLMLTLHSVIHFVVTIRRSSDYIFDKFSWICVNIWETTYLPLPYPNDSQTDNKFGEGSVCSFSGTDINPFSLAERVEKKENYAHVENLKFQPLNNTSWKHVTYEFCREEIWQDTNLEPRIILAPCQRYGGHHFQGTSLTYSGSQLSRQKK